MNGLVCAATICVCLLASELRGQPDDRLELVNDSVKLTWTRQADGWRLTEILAKGASGWVAAPTPSGLHTVLYINRNPAAKLVDLDKEGIAYPFYPAQARKSPDGKLIFRQQLSVGEVVSEWSLDTDFPSDVRVRLSFEAAQGGRASLITPTLAIFDPKDIAWGMVPGNWYGTSTQPNFELSPEYSQGLPNRPYLAKEKNTMTPCPLLSSRNGVTVAVIPDPEACTDVWASDHSTRDEGRLAFSTMDRYAQLAPVVYSPVMGEFGSSIEKGGKITLDFRYSIQAAPWFAVFRHAVMDVYRFPEILALQSSRESLADRVRRLARMLRDEKTSGWKIVHFGQSDLGANGTKTSDVGAMYMLAGATGDPVLNSRLPFIRNYKLAQQQTAPGFFQYVATGEYPGENGFAAERGNWIEPLFTTYYTMLDMGNMALFNPDDKEIRQRIRLAADKLIQWQHPDGSWDVAYDSVSHNLSFPSLTDLRPTWYGLFVAWRILGDDRYLIAARRGADWYLDNAVAKGHYLGACGDALNIWDFTTAFGAQALLDLYDQTHDERYKAAAIEVAKVYATTIFTHPLPTTKTKTVGSVQRKDWEISQVGLSVEHIRGTASSGPILLSSHAGMFVRIYQLTQEKVFLDMARAAARGRHHFVDPDTGMSIYYWSSLDRVDKMWKLFPWHAEWQVGWIGDYLLSEAHLRSGGRIAFPAGFPTPKVGPHVTYGFKPGTIYGEEATLWLGDGAVASDNPNVEYISAFNAEKRKLFVIVLNQFPREQIATLCIDRDQKAMGHSLRWSACSAIAGKVMSADSGSGTVQVQMPPWGLAVLSLETVGCPSTGE